MCLSPRSGWVVGSWVGVIFVLRGVGNISTRKQSWKVAGGPVSHFSTGHTPRCFIAVGKFFVFVGRVHFCGRGGKKTSPMYVTRTLINIKSLAAMAREFPVKIHVSDSLPASLFAMRRPILALCLVVMAALRLGARAIWFRPSHGRGFFLEDTLLG